MAEAATQAVIAASHITQTASTTITLLSSPTEDVSAQRRSRRLNHDAFYVLLPLIVVMSTFLLLMVVFLICVLVMRRRRGISLRDSDGPVDLSREDLIHGEGGFDGVETRWLESVSDAERREYNRAKGV